LGWVACRASCLLCGDQLIHLCFFLVLSSRAWLPKASRCLAVQQAREAKRRRGEPITYCPHRCLLPWAASFESYLSHHITSCRVSMFSSVLAMETSRSWCPNSWARRIPLELRVGRIGRFSNRDSARVLLSAAPQDIHSVLMMGNTGPLQSNQRRQWVCSTPVPITSHQFGTPLPQDMEG
jgi:hypothetical protein